MKGIKLKILLVFLMLIPVPFSCKDNCKMSDGLEVEPYFSMQDLDFEYVDVYYVHKTTQKLMFDAISQDFENIVYTCQNMALYVKAPDDALLYHSQNNLKNGFCFTQEVFASCERKQPGYAGTLDRVDKIFISSNYDFDETHPAGYDMSDIVDIFAYTINGENSWMLLRDYNASSPYEAPKRFHLLIKTPARLSDVQQFVITYLFYAEPGEPSRQFRIETPVFKVKI